jgi:ribonucleotide monophosphatase NagD (HAD superfamily)
MYCRKGESLIPGAPHVLEQLHALGKKVLFVTNNSTKSRRRVLSKFYAMGMMEVLLEG